MKLRNKKTGEVFNFVIKAEQDNTASYFTLKTGSGGWEDGLTYGTLEELHEEWEDYTPTELPIKDEKIREIVRAWIKVNGDVGLTYDAGENSLKDIFTNEISFNQKLDLIDDHFYTANELCGDEEE